MAGERTEATAGKESDDPYVRRGARNRCETMRGGGRDDCRLGDASTDGADLRDRVDADVIECERHHENAADDGRLGMVTGGLHANSEPVRAGEPDHLGDADAFAAATTASGLWMIARLEPRGASA